MRQFRIILLLSAAMLCSGYKWRCFIFCDEQTNIQGDYTVDRDTCRQFAQNKLEDSMKNAENPNSPKAKQTMLINLFSDCMGKFGWDVPSGEKKPAELAAAKAAPAPAVVTEYRQIQPIVINRTESCKSEYPQTVAKDKKKPTQKKKIKKRNNCTPEELKKLEEQNKPAEQPKIAPTEKNAEKSNPVPAKKEAIAEPPKPQEKPTEKTVEKTIEKPPEPPIEKPKTEEPLGPRIWKKPEAKVVEKPIMREPLSEAPVNLLDKQLSK